MTLALPTDVKEAVALKNERRIFGPPGTGKTTHLAKKIKGYIEDKKYRPSEIVVTSFTRAAAAEVASRGTGIPQENIQTLHALGYRALGGGEIAETHIVEWNKWVSEKKKMPRFQMSTGSGRDAEDRQDDDRAPRGAPGDGTFTEYMIRRAKLQPLQDKAIPFFERFVALWSEWKRETGYIDFQDMIDLPFERQLPPPHGAKVLICDEFQDFTKAEARLARFWGAQIVELILAGDDDQCLYGFKGASAENLLYPELPAEHITVLERSYRVPRAVQAYAERWISMIPKANRYQKKYEARDFKGRIRYEPVGTEPTDAEFASVEAAINKHRAEARYEDKKAEHEEKGNDADKAERAAWEARAARMALPEGDTEDTKKALTDAEKVLTDAEKALTDAKKALTDARDEEEKARRELVAATEAAAVKVVDLVAEDEADPDNAVLLDYARVSQRLTTISLHSGKKDPVKRSWEDPEVYLKNALVRYAARGKSIMFLASCAYMLEPLKAMLRGSGIPFHNPYRRKRVDWNPLQPSANGVSSTDRLLAFLRPSVNVWGNEARMWTLEDFMWWTDVLQKKGVLRHHGKTSTAIKQYYEELADNDPAALGQSLDLIEHLSEWLSDEALQNALDQNIEWFESKLLAAKDDAMQFPLHVAKTLGGAALLQEPNIILGTVHSVKGGTVDVVYLFPDISMNAMKETKTQEGRDALVRMFYVGMTRAKETLVLCAPANGERCAKFPRP